MRFTEQQIRDAVAKSTNITQVCKNLGCRHWGGSYYNINTRILRYKIDTSHFNQSYLSRGGKTTGAKRKPTVENVLKYDETLISRAKHKHLKQCLLEIGRKYCCAVCGNTGEWNRQQLDLQVDHIDGNWKNNDRDNLRFICPNCHSQTKTFSNKKRD